MSTRALPDLVAPRGEAGQELSSLLAARAKLDEQLDALDLQQREASEARDRASAELADLERAAAAGQQVSAASRTKAENALTEARILAAEPWAERREGIRAAARDHDRTLNAFVAEHFGELLDELHEDADAAAEAVTAPAATSSWPSPRGRASRSRSRRSPRWSGTRARATLLSRGPSRSCARRQDCSSQAARRRRGCAWILASLDTAGSPPKSPPGRPPSRWTSTSLPPARPSDRRR